MHWNTTENIDDNVEVSNFKLFLYFLDKTTIILFVIKYFRIT